MPKFHSTFTQISDSHFVWKQIFMEWHAAWKKCGTRDYISIFFCQIQHFFWRTPTLNMSKKRNKKISEALEKKMKKSSKLPHFYRFFLVSGVPYSCYYLRSTHNTHNILSRIFFSPLIPIQSLPSYTHFFSFLLLCYKKILFCSIIKMKRIWEIK